MKKEKWVPKERPTKTCSKYVFQATEERPKGYLNTHHEDIPDYAMFGGQDYRDEREKFVLACGYARGFFWGLGDEGCAFVLTHYFPDIEPYPSGLREEVGKANAKKLLEKFPDVFPLSLAPL